MVKDGILYVTNSILQGVAACDTKALLAYHHKLASTERAAAPYAGTCSHLALAEYLKGSPVTKCLAAFDDEYEAFSDESVPSDDRLSHRNVRGVLEQFITTHPLHSMPFRANAKLIEVPFSQPLTDDITFIGTIDALVESNNAYYVLDWKTTGQLSPFWAKKFRVSPQISGYVWAARQQCTLDVVGGFIGAIEIKKPYVSTSKCREHGVPYVECGALHAKAELLGPISRTESQLSAWKLDAILLARRYRELIERFHTRLDVVHVASTQGMFNDSCSLCDFYDYCSVGKPQQLLSSFGPSSYDPFKGIIERDAAGGAGGGTVGSVVVGRGGAAV